MRILKSRKMSFLLILSASLISACGSGSSGDNNGGANSRGVERTLMIAGDDTTTLGAELILTEVAYRENFGFSNKIVIATTSNLLDLILAAAGEGTANFTGQLSLNRTVFNIMPFGISMTIFRGEKEWAYSLACAGSNGFTTNCSSINFDTANRTITLTDTVVNAATGGSSISTASLIINGTITWVAGDEKPRNENNNNKNVNGSLTDITGVWQEDDPFGYNSELGYADEVYEIYTSDGKNLRFEYFTNLDCYENHLGRYEDFGNGNISRDGDDPYNFSIEGNTMTVTYLDNENILIKSTLTEADFVPICDY